MKYNVLGRTGLYVSQICLGTMTYGGSNGIWGLIGKMDQSEVNQHIKMALSAGVNFIDTANVYSLGESEQLLGQALQDLKVNRDDLVIATKVRGSMGEGPNDSGLSRKHIFKQVDDSLKRLQTDFIDLYQIHGFDPITPLEETLSALDDLVRIGKVRYLGVSNHSAWQMMKALGVSERKGLARFESIQAYYSLAGRDLEREIVPFAQDQQLGILAWSPLAGGLLSGKYTREGGPESARRAKFDFPPVDRDRAFACIEVAETIAQSKNISVAQLALAWVLHQPAMTSIIIGAKTEDQLSQNLAAVNVELSTDELEQLNTVSALPAEYPGWMIERQSADRKRN